MTLTSELSRDGSVSRQRYPLAVWGYRRCASAAMRSPGGPHAPIRALLKTPTGSRATAGRKILNSNNSSFQQTSYCGFIPSTWRKKTYSRIHTRRAYPPNPPPPAPAPTPPPCHFCGFLCRERRERLEVGRVQVCGHQWLCLNM